MERIYSKRKIETNLTRDFGTYLHLLRAFVFSGLVFMAAGSAFCDGRQRQWWKTKIETGTTTRSQNRAPEEVRMWEEFRRCASIGLVARPEKIESGSFFLEIRRRRRTGEKGKVCPREGESDGERGSKRDVCCAPGFQPSQHQLVHLARRASFFLGVQPFFVSAQSSPFSPACLVGKKLCTLPHSPIYIHCKEDLAANPDWFQNFQPNSGWDYPRYFEIEKKDSFWRIEKDFVWTDLRNNPWGVQHRR